jgi:hypothetical protein
MGAMTLRRKRYRFDHRLFRAPRCTLTRVAIGILCVELLLPMVALASDLGNRLSYLGEDANPYAVSRQTAKLVTPQWIGQSGVDAVLVLAIDDMTDPRRYEEFLRPILTRLKRIDGRAPVSIMTQSVDPRAPQLQQWLREGLSIEAHTIDHPCPCLQKGKLSAAKETYDRCIDHLAQIPNMRAVAFRMPCCDSMNSVSPRFFTQLFNKTTPGGNFLRIDSSVFLLLTANDPSLPRELVIDEDGREKFRKYIPSDRLMINTIEDYPYPYTVGHQCWEIPCLMPSDWDAQHLHGKCNPRTVTDLKAAIDALVIKRGIAALCFHPHEWIRNDQLVELIDHVVVQHGKRVQFLTFPEVQARLEKNLLGGHSLRATDGSDQGVRLVDVNNDGYMDALIGNPTVQQTRVWSPSTGHWSVTSLPVAMVTDDGPRRGADAGVKFGVLHRDGRASLVVHNDAVAGMWHFDGRRWVAVADGLTGLQLDGPVRTQTNGRARGALLRDLDRDGMCELIVGNPGQQGVFAWRQDHWQLLPFQLPAEMTIVDAEGRDAGLRLIDFDEDGRDDIILSNPQRYAAYAFASMADGWSRKMFDAPRRGPTAKDPQRKPPATAPVTADEATATATGSAATRRELPLIVRADGTSNGAWFSYRHMWVQNEDTGGALPDHIERRSFTRDFLATEKEPPPSSPQSGR